MAYRLPFTDTDATPGDPPGPIPLEPLMVSLTRKRMKGQHGPLCFRMSFRSEGSAYGGLAASLIDYG